MSKVSGLGRRPSSGSSVAPSSWLSRGLWFLTLGDVIQLAGAHVLTIAVSSYAFRLTGSAWGFAIQQLVMFLPWVLFSGVAGPVVDRLDKRKVMISAGVLRGAVCLAYPYCASLEGILLLNFLNSVGGVFLVTARTALVPRLCDRQALLQANGVRAAVFGCIDVTVPAIAGAAIGQIGSTMSFRIASTGYLIGALWFALVPSKASQAGRPAVRPNGGVSSGILSSNVEPGARMDTATEPGARLDTATEPGARLDTATEPGARVATVAKPAAKVHTAAETGVREDAITTSGGTEQTPGRARVFRDFIGDMKGAYAYIRSNKGLMAAMLLHCIYMGGQNGANAIYYPFVETVLKAGPEFFGLAVSLYHGANLAAGFLLTRFGDTLRRQPATRFIVPTTMVWVFYSLNRSVPLVLTVGVIEGMTMSFLSNLFMTRVQEEAPPEMTGRVWGLVTSVTSASEVAGILLAGAVAGRFGPLVAYCTLGVTVPLLTLIASARSKSGAALASKTV